MHVQASVPGETAWNVVLTGTSVRFFSLSRSLATFSSVCG